MRIGIAGDHGGFELKVQLSAALKAAGYEVADFGGRPCCGIRDCLPVGGQPDDLASARLNAMNLMFKTRIPWALTVVWDFSFLKNWRIL